MDNNEQITGLSFNLSRAVSAGRENRGRPDNRETVLARLLVKRAAAHRAGLSELEAIMRRQIQWALPIIREPEREIETSDIAA